MKTTLLFSATALACLSITGVAAADDTSAPASASIPATPPVSQPSSSAPAPLADPAARGTDTTLYMSRAPSRFWLYTGLITLAGTYTTTAVVAANDGSIRDKDLYIPIVGPWINLASRSGGSAGDTVLIAGSGVLQGVSAGMVVASFFMKEKFPTATISAGNVTVTPSASLGAVGAVGTF